MQLLEQPNRWSCTITSLAMLLDKPLRTLTLLLGHDGSEIILPNNPEPSCRRSFIMNELQDLANHYGKVLVPYDADPIAESLQTKYHLYHSEYAELRIDELMKGHPGLIEGAYALNKPHMVAWDGYKVYDPSGPKSYSFDSNLQKINILCFWRLFTIKSY